MLNVDIVTRERAIADQKVLNLLPHTTVCAIEAKARMYRGERRDDTYNHGLSRKMLRVKKLPRVGRESKCANPNTVVYVYSIL